TDRYRHASEGWHPFYNKSWTPAFAGVTAFGLGDAVWAGVTAFGLGDAVWAGVTFICSGNGVRASGFRLR
ncbi:hypothetical protein OAE16_02825, partial [Porticoccaceae bacterium]|nr:hypothetical protein [Porticoccaceae bacterium]